MRARGWTAGLTALLGLAAGCGSSLAPDPSIVPLSSWGGEYAAVTCAKIFGCCDSSERTTFGYASEADCRQTIGTQRQTDLNEAVAQGLVVYDKKAARRCIDELNAAASCADLFNRSTAQVSPSCAVVTTGAGKLGAVCEDLDLACESSNCLPSTGTCGPPRGCPVACDAGQYCDDGTHACVPVNADGATCYGDNQCAPPSVCRMNVCGAPLADGATCSYDTECAGGTCIVTVMATATTSAIVTCGPLLPNDATCFDDKDCLSGACIGTAPAPRVCVPPLPDGSPCASNAECAGGTCATRASGASSTCGPPLCDGV